jgi:thiol-disulfide isomerase/thioredoxin
MFERKSHMKFWEKISRCNLTILRMLAILLVFFFSFNYGQRAVALEKPDESQTSVQQPSGNQSNTDASQIEILQTISKAQLDGKYVFLMFYEPGNSDCQIMGERLDEFAQHTAEKVEIVKIDRSNPKNSTIVASMRVQTAPVPLTLVKDPNGQVVKAFKTVVSEEEIKFAIPSPKKAEAFTFLKDGKSLILSFTSKAMPSGNEIEQTCEEAKNKLEGKAAHISVDVTDPKEAGFLKEMRVSPDSPEPVTIVINSQRQIAGTYTGKIKADELVLAATKVAAGGCCPGGGGSKGCGPARQ